MELFLRFIIIVVIIIFPSGSTFDCPDEDPLFYHRHFVPRGFKSLRIADRFCIPPLANFSDDPRIPPSQEAGGIPAEPGEFTYMCAIGWPSATNSSLLDFKCGGAAISRHFVLTAAHCAYVNGKSPVGVLVGGPNLTDTTAVIHNISQIFLHPDYDPNSVYHDIAIIQTKEGIITEYACLWTSFELQKDHLISIGYGDTKFAGYPSPILLKVDLVGVSNEVCEQFYEPNFQMTDGVISKQLCANDPEQYRDSCQGDSGGPLLMRKCSYCSELPYIVGITSFGIGCGGEPPSIYTRVSEYLDWIEKIVWPEGETLYLY